MVRQPTWQRIILLIVLGYEGFGGLSGGGLLVAAPDGRLMDMPVAAMHGFFPDFLIPGLILIGMGLLTVAAFVAVWRRSRFDWLLAGLALGGFTVWFIVEIAVLGQVLWIHAMWGLPVLVGGFVAVPLVPIRSGVSFVKSHPVLTYYVLTFGISWGGVLLVVGGPGRIPGTLEETTALFPLVFLTTVIGPALASVVLIGLVGGRAGFSELLSRLLRWRVGVRWYGVALLTTPLTVLAVLLALSLFSPEFLPGFLAARGSGPAATGLALPVGVVVSIAILTGFLEETGWTGFAIPRLRRRYGIFSTGLFVGLLWGAWHFVSNDWGSSSTEGVPVVLYLPALLFTFLPPYRVLMVWLYDHTGSLLVSMLMHASLVTFWLLATPPGIAGWPLVIWYVAWAVLLWIVVGVVVVASRGKVSRQPLRVVQPAPRPTRKQAA